MFDFTQLTKPNFSFAEAQQVTFPLLLFVVGIFIYAWFIFKFYRFLANRDVFELNLQQYSESFMGGIQVFLSGLFYVLEFFLILPFFAFFWFAVLALVLVFLSKSNMQSILLVAMALVGSVRVTAYYNEDLSRDLAKMLPFALLGIFLVDISFFSYQESLDLLFQFPNYWKYLVYYLAFIVLLELLLRILYGVAVLARRNTAPEETPPNYNARPPPQKNFRRNPPIKPNNQRIVVR
jgi:hypothetical protein